MRNARDRVQFLEGKTLLALALVQQDIADTVVELLMRFLQHVHLVNRAVLFQALRVDPLSEGAGFVRSGLLRRHGELSVKNQLQGVDPLPVLVADGGKIQIARRRALVRRRTLRFTVYLQFPVQVHQGQ